MILEVLNNKKFCKDIYDGEITLENADKDQSDLLNEIENFNDKQDQKTIYI